MATAEQVKELSAKITQWGKDRNIIGGVTALDQLPKLGEELGELVQALNDPPYLEKESFEEVADAIGDSLVVLHMICGALNINFFWCVAAGIFARKHDAYVSHMSGKSTYDLQGEAMYYDRDILYDQLRQPMYEDFDEVIATLQSKNSRFPKRDNIATFSSYGQLCAALGHYGTDRLWPHKVERSIGELLLRLQSYAADINKSLAECMEGAYNEIKDRKGKIVDGIFVKEAE